MLEPLGRSQVLGYLSRLSNDYIFTLVSFEKQKDFADEQAVAEMHQECTNYGITWRPRVYHHRPRLLATLWDLLVLLWLTFWYSARRKVCLVHCRSYIPAIAAWLCGKITHKPFIFDMRALWPDEMISAGRLDKASIIYMLLKKMEYWLLRDAHVVVSLTEAAVTYLTRLYVELDKSKFHVITTCVDLSRFDLKEKRQPFENKQFVLGTMGTLLSGWFHLDWLFEFFLDIEKRQPGVILKIVTKDDHAVIIQKALEAGIPKDKLVLESCQPNDIHQHITDFDVAVLFFVSDIGKFGSSPTRLGELLAAGVPIVGNHGIGDMGTLIEEYGVGIAVQEGTIVELSRAADQLIEYLHNQYDPMLCRKAAEDYFSVEKGVDQYRTIYSQVESL